MNYHDEKQNKDFVFEWQAAISKRTIRKQNCPYLAGKLVHPGFNDLESQYPEIAAEWNYEKNYPLLPSEIACNSGRKVWWILPYHDERQNKNFIFEWETHVYHRTLENTGCPYLSGSQVYPGFNDLESQYPDIVQEWNYEKNFPLLPSQVTSRTPKKVWWRLNYHDEKQNKDFVFEWQAHIADRTMVNYNCPYLSGKLVYPGFNDLESQYPDIAREWNYEKNYPLLPSEIACKSGKKVWWLLPYDDPKTGKHFDFEWQANVYDRTALNHNCPYLSGKQTWKGFNDLETLNPELAKEWNYEKNYPLKPSDVTLGSNKKVWWKCKTCGHEWLATVSSRTFKMTGCAECSKYFSSSFPEAATYFYVKKHFPDTIWIHRSLGFELDVYIPSLKTGIEYDGFYWHRNKQEKDKEKNQKCLNNNITLWRIRENLPSLNDTSYDIILLVRNNEEELSVTLKQLFKEAFNLDADIDIFRDYDEIQELYVTHNTKKSLEYVYPELLPYFNRKKNKIAPVHVSVSSQRKYFWTDPDTGASIQATVRVMVSKVKKYKGMQT